MEAIIKSAKSPHTLSATLVAATQDMLPDGKSKARALLDRLQDYVDTGILIDDVPVFIAVLLKDGDRLLVESDARSMFGFGNDMLIFRLVYNLVKRLKPDDRLAVLKPAFEGGNSLYSQSLFLRSLLDDVAKGMASHPLLEVTDLDALKNAWVSKVRSMRNELLSHPQLRTILLIWQMWGDPEEVRGWCNETMRADDALFQFLERFTHYSSSNTIGDAAITKRLRLNPKWLDDFSPSSTIADRLTVLQKKGLIPENAKANVAQFFDELKMIQEGKDPDSPFALRDND